MTSRIPTYESFISPSLFSFLVSNATPIQQVPHLFICRSPEEEPEGTQYESASLTFLCSLYDIIKPKLAHVLHVRQQDRKWIDQQTKILSQNNIQHNRSPGDQDFESVVGRSDGNGRIAVGPLPGRDYRIANGGPVSTIPEYLRGSHVTLFGPADNPRMCVNALNSTYRVIPGEPGIVRELVERSSIVPKWGADDEDSKTPLRGSFLSSMVNLKLCFEKTIHVEGLPLEKTRLAHPIKRIPGLGLPSTSLIYKGDLIPLHVYDFAMHIFHMWDKPESLTFYIPKLENDEEALYLHDLIEQAEIMIKSIHPEYQIGTVRIMVVLENPRAVFRINEIMDALYPYFVGASLGWHDYVAATARLFKEDPSYRMPCKSDPQIVVKHIKESHVLLSRVVKPRGGVAIGGMYGVLPLERDLHTRTMQTTLMGYIRDVIAQLRRGLDGFWVAHPDFVRIGIAIVEAYHLSLNQKDNTLELLINALILDPEDRQKVIDFVTGGDKVQNLDPNDPLYPRALLASELNISSAFIQNNDPEEVRYNVFQALQYLADWLRGNGCVALPASIGGVQVRVMDDLATTERSRWEVWHELKHGRFELVDVVKIMREEIDFIYKNKKDLKTGKVAHVLLNNTTAKWYPVAKKILLKLMCEEEPAEFVTEYLMPFTIPQIRNSDDPWRVAMEIDMDKFSPDKKIFFLDALFEACFCKRVVLECFNGLAPSDLSVEEIELACSYLPPQFVSRERDMNKFFKERLSQVTNYFLGDKKWKL